MTENLDAREKASGLANIYLMAKDAVIAQGFAWEIEWQADRNLDHVTESDFLKESAWTVLSSGFRESVVRRLFGDISDAFLEWRSAAEIHSARSNCRRAALCVFRNQRKIDAILKIAEIVHERGFDVIRCRIKEEDVQFLRTLPYVGVITSFHLAKNLGLPVVKPDRHMQRIARAADFSSPDELCRTISRNLGEPIQVVDVVLWRYATLFSDYVKVFTTLSETRCSRTKSR